MGCEIVSPRINGTLFAWKPVCSKHNGSVNAHMRGMKWLVPILLFLSPVLVAFAQASVLDFPAKDPFSFGFEGFFVRY